VTLRWFLAALHLVALGVGLGAVWSRGRSLASEIDQSALRRAFRADSLWGLAAVLWISTGLWRLLAATEKTTGYYLQNHLFLAKMGLLVVIILLELWPMATLIGWRRRGAAGQFRPDIQTARRIAGISYLQAVLVILMVFAATAMARGIGARGTL
jgi:putative membrane protein